MGGGRRRVLVVGAGSLGTVYGARLAAVADVQLLGRRAHAEAIQAAGGAILRDDDGETLVPVRAEWRPERIEPADVAIVLTKSHDTDAALAELGHLVGDLELAVSLQNGVEKDARLAAWCGAGRVVGGSSMVGATLERPGRVRHTLRGTTYLGELPAGTSPRVDALAALLEAAGMPALATDRVLSVEWSKLVHASPAMSLPALTRLPLHRVLADERLARLYVDLVREGAAVASAAGTALDDWPGMFPVRTVADADPAAAVALVRDRARAMGRAGGTAVRVSMLEDVERGRRLELDAVHGFLLAEGRRLGVAMPRSAVALRLLSALGGIGVRRAERASAVGAPA